MTYAVNTTLPNIGAMGRAGASAAAKTGNMAYVQAKVCSLLGGLKNVLFYGPRLYSNSWNLISRRGLWTWLKTSKWPALQLVALTGLGLYGLKRAYDWKVSKATV